MPESNASALPAEAGSISGTLMLAIAATPDPIPNRTNATIFRILLFLRVLLAVSDDNDIESSNSQRKSAWFSNR